MYCLKLVHVDEGNSVDMRGGNCSYSVRVGLGRGKLAIEYRPRFKTRNEEIIAKLRNSAGASPPVDPQMRIKRLIAEAAVLIALVHGGEWRTEIAPEKGFLLVSRRGRKC